MILRPLLAAGALALQTSAFLIPLEISDQVEKAKTELATLLPYKAQTLQLACPGCVFPGPEDGSDFTTEDATSIELKFVIKDQGDNKGTGLEINDAVVWTNQQPKLPGVVDAALTRTSDSASSRPLPLDYAFEVSQVHRSHQEGGITTVQFTVLSVDGRLVSVDSVKLDIDEALGQFFIGKITTVPFEDSPGADCKTTVCRVRAIISARVKQMLAAAKARAHAAGGWVRGGCRGKKIGDMRENPQKGTRPHPHHHHDHRRIHRLRKILRQTFRFFIIPALLGVVGGLMASAIGMLVGQAIVYTWFRFHRRGHRGNMRVTEIAVQDDEKNALIDGEQPPQYEDVETIVVDEVKG